MAQQSLYSRSTGMVSCREAAGADVDHPPPCSVEVKNEWSYTSSLLMYLLQNMETCCSRTVILNKFRTNNFSLHKQWFPTCVRLNNSNLVRKEPYSICVWYSRINYTDVTCQWSIEPFVRDTVGDRQSGFLGNGTEFYSMQNFESTPLEIRTNRTVEGNSKRSRSSGNHVSCIGLSFRPSEYLVKHSNRKRLPLPTQSLQVDAPELTIRTIYWHTNNTLAFEPNLPRLCNVVTT